VSSTPSAAQASDAAVPAVELALMLEAETGADQRSGGPDPLLDPDAAEAVWSQQLALWLGDLRAELPTPWRSPAYSLSLSLVDDASMARLNLDWRQVQGPTDVLAFAALEEAPPLPEPADATNASQEPLELGDIVISLDTARRQALEAGQTLRRELLFLASHGLLHLLGWDHPDQGSLEAMLARQERLIRLAGEPS
jgi:probable rRNA maturation factor